MTSLSRIAWWKGHVFIKAPSNHHLGIDYLVSDEIDGKKPTKKINKSIAFCQSHAELFCTEKFDLWTPGLIAAMAMKD